MTGIVFEAFDDLTLIGDGFVELFGSGAIGSGGLDGWGFVDLVGAGLATISVSGSGFVDLRGTASLLYGAGGVDGDGVVETAGSAFFAPALPTVVIGLGVVEVLGAGIASLVANGDGEIHVFGSGSVKHGAGGIDGDGFVAPGGTGLVALNYTGGFGVLQTPGYVYMQSLLPDNVSFVFDRVNFYDAFSTRFVLALQEALVFGDLPDAQYHAIVNIIASLAFHDALGGGTYGPLTDETIFADAATATAMQIAALLDSFTVSATANSTAVLFGFVTNAFSFSDSTSFTSVVRQMLQDGLQFGMTLYTGQDTYTAWVMTPETRAMRSYDDYPFNSYAPLDGKLCGAVSGHPGLPDGVYTLEGKTDAGAAIYASVRSGLLDFGSRQLKRMDRAYLGYTSAGVVCLRVTTTSPEGKKVTYTYKAVQTPSAGAPRETRVQIGRGLQSVYWQFELDNSVDASGFELHDVVVLPMTLTRKVR